MDKKFVLDLNLSDWEAYMKEKSYPKFRASQIFSWYSKGVLDMTKMSNVPQEIKNAVREDFITDSMSIEKHLVSEIDGTQKFVFRLYDGHCVETVLMRYKTGLSICISSQAGCKMGCRFCASAHAGFGRSLTRGEMLGQVLLAGSFAGERIHSVVVMGIGEPFDNYDELIGFLRLANDEKGLNLGARHITVSTCGLVPQMIQFSLIDMQVNLSVSLHAPNDELRKSIMPIANKYSLSELLGACREYEKNTNRRITFEYSLFDGVNDTPECARELCKVLKGIHCHINLIAANEFDGSPFRRSKPGSVRAFQDLLEKNGMTVTLRREMGTDIMAACGQLRRGMQEKKET
ncbi:MAG: 23S rRNA (adenine(2503)-C(2))-methyltransferase RlmN [Clostridiales bacterium]|nr:23S rRNA (adenine(2503)-C(2))-methyltransferase RlmN [Clostridiales bacterium]MBQ5967226.1 23S rRNA (adenine(2503)-C(2))-methyltransferase RlmN [Clostridiales bacterium]MBR4010373.1 23S rRNA (adenine(2503)-C(2))-methyltransferase RlmN [Clostridiales bacterium]MCR5059037.1 23S rRNA (adenine(2503)-C(2))-methyltransferase RlmN [Clostridiales bacterium]